MHEGSNVVLLRIMCGLCVVSWVYYDVLQRQPLRLAQAHNSIFQSPAVG